MKDYSIQTIINNYFNIYHKNLTVLDIGVKRVEEDYKMEHPNAKIQIEVSTAYSTSEILLKLGYTKEEILKNNSNDVWLESVERKHNLKEQSLVSPIEYYLFIEDSEKYHNDLNWKNYYNTIKERFKNEKLSNDMQL